jgi:hypothetical protein
MPWIIVRHWAELALLLAVLKMFQHCHSLGDVFQVIQAADDITRLGVVTASVIAACGLGEMLTALAHAAHLPALWQWVVKRISRTW